MARVMSYMVGIQGEGVNDSEIIYQSPFHNAQSSQYTIPKEAAQGVIQYQAK